LALSLLIFTWTPTHFWSLAMAYRKDYAGAGYPMLPVNTSPRGAAWWVAIHTLATGLIAIILSFHPSLGIVYFLPVGIITYQFIKLAVRLIRRPKGNKALNLFKFSNLYLGIVLLIIIILPVIG
jgi:protoheme IX farnesyltransferase